MPIEFSCTKCSAKFRVPDAMAGKKVRCPKCQSIEMVPAGDQPVKSAGKEQDDDFWKQRPGHSSVNSLDGLLSDGAYELKPPTSSPSDERSKSEILGIGNVRSRIATAGTVLLIVSILVTTLNAIGIILFLLQITFAPPNMDGRMILFAMVMSGISICLTCATLKGVNSFRNIDDLGWAWTGLILSMTPFGTSICCVITLPFAIWGIILLSDKRIAAHYRG